MLAAGSAAGVGAIVAFIGWRVVSDCMGFARFDGFHRFFDVLAEHVLGGTLVAHIKLWRHGAFCARTAQGNDHGFKRVL